MTDQAPSSATPATPAPAAAADAAPVPFDPFDPSKVAQETHIADVFGFDPADVTVPEVAKAGGGDRPAEGDAAPASAGPSVGAEGGEEGAGGEAAPSEPQRPSEQDLKITSLEAQIAELKKQLEAKEKVETPPVQQPQQPQQPQPQQPQPPAQPLQIKLPQALRDDLISGEDERMVGAIEQITGALAGQMQQLATMILPRLEALEKPSAAPAATPAPAEQQSTDQVDAQVQQMRDQYFSKFPAHKSPEFQPIIAAVAGEMAAQFPGHPWDDAYIASMGARVTERARQLAKLMAGGQTAQPPSALPAGNRSAAPAAGQMDLSDEVMDLLS